MPERNTRRQTILSKLLIQYRSLGERWLGWFQRFRKKDSLMETSHRRHDARGGIDNFTKRIWDAVKEPQRVVELLRKQSPRTRKDEEVQRREEEIRKRNFRLSRLEEQEGWRKDVVGMLRQWENFCYMNLRFPETRKENVSFEYYTGFQNGALWIIESLRKEIYNAVLYVKKEALKEAEKKKTSSNL